MKSGNVAFLGKSHLSSSSRIAKSGSLIACVFTVRWLPMYFVIAYNIEER